jgi:hypothetical protein
MNNPHRGSKLNGLRIVLHFIAKQTNTWNVRDLDPKSAKSDFKLQAIPIDDIQNTMRYILQWFTETFFQVMWLQIV